MVNVRHFGIVVQDIEKSLWFYRDLLGLEVAKDMVESGDYIDNFSDLEDVKVRTVKMFDKSKNGMVELLSYESHPDKNGVNIKPINILGCSHVAFTVDNLDEKYKELVNKGLKFNSQPQLSPDGFAKVTFCRDPEGCLVELVEELK